MWPSGNGPPPDSRGGTQNSATTARMSAGISKNASNAYWELPGKGAVEWRSRANLAPRSQHRMALPNPATAPNMRTIGDVIGREQCNSGAIWRDV